MTWSAERWAQLSPRLDELLELEAPVRDARLAELEEVDPGLAADLRRLLAEDAREAGVLDRGVARIAPTVLEGLSAAVAGPSLPEGTRIGDYRLLRPLGRGGMGEVYLAQRSTAGVEQQVALKLLKRGMDSDELLRRFVQERRILAQLNHPHIAGFLDGGVEPDGRPYFAMEFVDGVALTEFARSRALDLRARVGLLATVCDAVAYAHTQLVVHRDLKPSNILVDGNGQPRVLDFGIAKLLGDGAPSDTATAARAMSPAYAAPEQILGEPIGTATDVYALGVVLFELLTGALPHDRSAASSAALALALAQETTTRPSQVLRQAPDRLAAVLGITAAHAARAARELNGDLDTIVLAALQREPQRRYGTAAALAEDLRRWLAGRPIAARADSAGYRMASFVRRHRGAVVSAAVAALALAAATGVSLWQAHLAQQQAARADAEARRAETEAAAAKQQTERIRRVKDFLVSVFVQEDPLRHTPGGAVTLAQAFDDTLKRVDAELGADPGLQADLLDDFGEITAAKGKFDEARLLFERALALAEKAHGPDDPAVAETLVNLGVLANYRGEVLAGKPYLVRAVAILAPHEQDRPGEYATALAALAGVASHEGNAHESSRMMQEVLAIQRRIHASPDVLVSALSNVAASLLNEGKYVESETLAREALALAERHFGTESPQVIPPIWTLEDVAYWRGDLAEQQRMVERRLAVARAAFPPGHPWVVTALGEAGFLQVRRGEVAAGEARMREAIAQFERDGNRGEEWQSVLRRLWISLQRRGESAAALVEIDKAWQSCIEQGAVIDHKMCRTIRANRAQSLAETGQGEQALAEAEAAVAALSTQSGGRSDELGQALEARAAALSALQRRPDAIAAQKEAVAMYAAVYGAEHSATRQARGALERLSKE